MHHHIKRDERIALAALLRAGHRQSDVARSLGVHRSTICRELKRNKGERQRYHAAHADVLSKARRTSAKISSRKIENDPILEKQIECRLHPLVSPEVVAHEVGVVHETIYAWIGRSRPDLIYKLPQRGRKRRRYGSKRTKKQGWTKNLRSIDQRFETLLNWEGDTVKGRTIPGF